MNTVRARRTSLRAVALAACAVLLACGSEQTVQMNTLAMAEPAAPSAAQWERLATKRIFFGHQSVGANILDGVRDLMAEDSTLRLNLVRSPAPSSVAGPALIEAFVGENGNPSSKGNGFAADLAQGMGAEGGIALYKYCYLDMQPGADPAALFAMYRANMDSLAARHPEVTFVHVTMPLTTTGSAPKQLLKKLMGKATTTDLNAGRNRYNAMLRETYGRKAPVFDLAEIESTRADGSRSFVTRGGQTIYTLAPEWTDDGGHLNAAGRKRVARAFLAYLASL